MVHNVSISRKKLESGHVCLMQFACTAHMNMLFEAQNFNFLGKYFFLFTCITVEVEGSWLKT